METEDSQQSPATVTSRVVTIGIWLVVLLVGYVVSVGPASWLMKMNVLPIRIFQTVYLPLIWLSRHSHQSWIVRVLNSWWEWWFQL